MNESLSQVFLALLSAGSAFAAAALGLVAVFRGAGAARPPLVRCGLALLVPSLLAVLANVAAAGGTVSWSVPAALAALGAFAGAASWPRAGKERERRDLPSLAGILLAALSALAAFLSGRGLLS